MAETADTWQSEFSEGDLAAVRAAIRESIRVGHERSSRAQTEYADPDNDQDVYGAGMARAVQKEMSARLLNLVSYREESTPRSRRKMIYVGNTLIFPHRVGKGMPRNHLRVRLNYLPDHRRDLLAKTSAVKYLPRGLFDMPNAPTDEPASFAEVMAAVEAAAPQVTLIVPYYSSTATGVGSVYWGPARLNGKYLEFTAPERITLERVPSNAATTAPPIAPAVPGFVSQERKRTPVRLRLQPGDDVGSK